PRCWSRRGTWPRSTARCACCWTTLSSGLSTLGGASNGPPRGPPPTRRWIRCALSTRSWSPPATPHSDGSDLPVVDLSRWRPVSSLTRASGRRRAAPYLVIAVAALAAIIGLTVHPVAPEIERTADYVVIAGAAGLRWSDVDPQRTPNLWRLATDGAI